MKTMSGGTRNPRRGLYVGLAMTLSASTALAGAGVWLTLGTASRAAAALAAGALACLAGAVLTAAAALREGRGRPAGPPPGPVAVPRPLGGEEAAAALAHARKMQALGLLSGGVAHDFNNQLHVIRNSLDVLLRQGPPPEARRYLEMIRRSADRAGALTRQLLAFSRRQPLELRPLDPNELVTQMAELLRHSLGERIKVQTALGPDVGKVTADVGQLEAALLNLAINARDAMSQAGLLTIETANAPLDESFVVIAVSDTGSGMPPEVAARACEPFFTTKEPGRGTGLGLSQVAGFARQAGGRLRIASELGKGTTVRLYLPRSERLTLDIGPARLPVRPHREAAQGVALAAGAGPER